MNFIQKNIRPKQNKYSIILSIDSNIIATKYIKLISYGSSSIVGVLQKIGLYTEDVSYTYANKEYSIPLKDKWSLQYERPTIKLGIDNFSGEIIIKIPEGNQLIWERLFYIGDSIKIIDYK
jgi:hypothetical protein